MMPSVLAWTLIVCLHVVRSGDLETYDKIIMEQLWSSSAMMLTETRALHEASLDLGHQHFIWEALLMILNMMNNQKNLITRTNHTETFTDEPIRKPLASFMTGRPCPKSLQNKTAPEWYRDIQRVDEDLNCLWLKTFVKADCLQPYFWLV